MGDREWLMGGDRDERSSRCIGMDGKEGNMVKEKRVRERKRAERERSDEKWEIQDWNERNGGEDERGKGRES